MTTIAPAQPCPNCGSGAVQSYCAGCGQRISGRLNLRGLVHLAREKLLDSEQGLIPTLWLTVTRPGHVPRDFIAGRRR